MILTREERERFVIDLYNQGKNYREIAEEARISFRDIGPIVKKAIKEKETMEAKQENKADNNPDFNSNNQKQPSLAGQASALFSQGKTPKDVAIELDLREPQVTKYQREYWKLEGLHDLNNVYQAIGGEGITQLLRLYKCSKAAGMDTENTVNLLEIANNDLPEVENRFNRIKKEVDHLKYRISSSERTLNDRENQIVTSRQTLDSYRISCEQERSKLESLHNEKVGLRRMVRRFKRHNEEYLKIKKTVEQEVTQILQGVKELLILAFYSLMESMRKDPNKYSALIHYNNNMVPAVTDYPVFYSADYLGYGLQKQQQYPSHDSFFETYKTMLLGDAEGLYNRLVKEAVNRIIAR
jgi:DNA-binding CsgD family transcriptional regulator